MIIIKVRTAANKKSIFILQLKTLNSMASSPRSNLKIFQLPSFYSYLLPKLQNTMIALSPK